MKSHELITLEQTSICNVQQIVLGFVSSYHERLVYSDEERICLPYECVYIYIEREGRPENNEHSRNQRERKRECSQDDANSNKNKKTL